VNWSHMSQHLLCFSMLMLTLKLILQCYIQLRTV
jgi:hypothetical protein